MLKKIIAWFKKLFGIDKEPSPLAPFVNSKNDSVIPQDPGMTVQDYKDHKYVNFLGCPVMYFPKNAANPAIGVVRTLSTLGMTTDGAALPAVVFYDFVSGMDVVVSSGFRIFSYKLMKQAMELPTRDRYALLYPEEADSVSWMDNIGGPISFKDLDEKLDRSGFYNTVNLYLRTMDVKDS